MMFKLVKKIIEITYEREDEKEKKEYKTYIIINEEGVVVENLDVFLILKSVYPYKLKEVKEYGAQARKSET